MYLVDRYSWMPSRPPSRPRPDCFTPPNGAAAFETTPDVEAHHAGLEPVDHPLAAGEVLGEDVADESVLGVVRDAHGLVLVA